MNSAQTLSGKRALVTGGSRGIGKSIAIALAEAGAAVAITARSASDLEATAHEIGQAGGQCIAIACDVTDPAAVAHMHDEVIKKLVGIDILVNNAGAADSHKFANHPDDMWHKLIDANLNSAYYVSKACVPGMLEQKWGRIIMIASLASKVGGKYIAAYTAAKHGVLGLARALAVELAPHITVNAICPGFVDTAMTDASVARISQQTGRSAEQARDVLEKTNLQQRLIEPEEVALVALMLAQETSRGITGQSIGVDGGAQVTATF